MQKSKDAGQDKSCHIVVIVIIFSLVLENTAE